MSISRREFFRGFTPKVSSSRSKLDRASAIDAYVRTHLLPYDFSLTDDEVKQVLETVCSGMNTESDETELNDGERRHMMDLAEQVIRPLRDQFWQAEEARRSALVFVREFLKLEATPEDLQKIRDRFQIPYLTNLEDEIERHVTSWLHGLPNARLAGLEGVSLRELVVSELKSWC